MKITDFVCFDALIPQLKANTRDDVIAELVNALDDAGKIVKGKADEIIKAVIQRENEASTGIGKAVAVPHVKHKSVRDVVAAIGVSAEGIDFSSLDKQPVFSVVLLVSPVEGDKHLQAMEAVFSCLQDDDFRKFLRQSQNVEQMKDLLMEADDYLLR